MAKRGRRVIVCVVSAALFVGACGGGESGTRVEAEKPIDAVLASSARMAEEKSSKVSFLMTFSAVGEEPFVMTGEGAFDFTTANGSLTMNMPEIEGRKLGQMEAVVVDGVIYQKFPPELAANMGGKPWIRNDLNERLGANVSQIAQSQSSNPAQMAALTLGAERVEEVGTEDVRGTSTTHYKVTVNLKKAAAAAEGELKKVVDKAVEMYKTETIPFEVWLDDDGLARRMKFFVDFSQMNLPEDTAAQMPEGSMDITMETYDFGTPVSVTAPPADQVTDMTSLAGSGGA